MRLCANCRHNPGRGRWCNTGHRHAVAILRDCDHHHRAPGSEHVGLLRRMALQELRGGDDRRYQRRLRAAHVASEPRW